MAQADSGGGLKMQSKRMLYVDDDYTAQKIMQIFLGRKNIAVDECMSATAAAPMINKNGYDAILVDYRLRFVTGVQLIKRLEGMFHCPVYIVSSQEVEYIKNEVKRIGANINGIISKWELSKGLEEMTQRVYASAF